MNCTVGCSGSGNWQLLQAAAAGQDFTCQFSKQIHEIVRVERQLML